MGYANHPAPNLLECRLSLGWAAILGRQHENQSVTNLHTASWASERAPLYGTGGVPTNTLPVGTVPTKFFRLLLLGS
jgi:hypothetical protein